MLCSSASVACPYDVYVLDHNNQEGFELLANKADPAKALLYSFDKWHDYAGETSYTILLVPIRLSNMVLSFKVNGATDVEVKVTSVHPDKDDVHEVSRTIQGDMITRNIWICRLYGWLMAISKQNKVHLRDSIAVTGLVISSQNRFSVCDLAEIWQMTLRDSKEPLPCSQKWCVIS